MNKLFPILTVICAILIGTAPTGVAISKVDVSIDVKPLDSGGATSNSGSTSGGAASNSGSSKKTTTDSYKTTHVRESGLTLGIDARNFGTGPAHVHVDWVFFTEAADGKGSPAPHTTGGKDIDLPPAGSLQLKAESGEIKSTTTKHLAIKNSTGGNGAKTQSAKASTDQSGSKLVGWYVRLLSNGEVVQVRASSPTYETLGKREK